MKLNYRERVVLIVVCAIAILLLGFFALIKPAYQALQKSKTELADVQEKWTQQLNEFKSINIKRTAILEKREKSAVMAENFCEKILTSEELDAFLGENFFTQEKLSGDKVIQNATQTFNNPEVSTISYYCYMPRTLSYELYELADFDGSLAKATEELMFDYALRSSQPAENIGCSSATFTMCIDREDMVDFFDAVKSFADTNKEAMIIRSIIVKDPEFHKPLNPEEDKKEEEDKDKEKTVKIRDMSAEIPGYSDVTITFDRYYVQGPTEVESQVGDEYDEKIWDGKEWKKS